MASLVEAIQQAEDHSTGEIRVHIDQNSDDNNAKIAFDVFKSLGMDKTKERNAVLFHVNFEQKYLTIIGDKGIHEKVHQKFWNDLHDKITSAFSQGQYFEGFARCYFRNRIRIKKILPYLTEKITMNYLMKLPSLKNFFVLVLLSCYSFISCNITFQNLPENPVYDEVGLLNATETEEINQKLIKFKDSSSTEILVVIIPTTNGEDVNFVATQWGRKMENRRKRTR